MLDLLCLVALVIWGSLWLLPWQPHRTRERFEPPEARAAGDLSRVSVLIPARNEALCLPVTLAALARQGPGLEVLLVDDESSDATATLAAELAAALRAPGDETRFALHVRVIRGRPLAAGWGGKLWALQQGLEQVERHYTLLLDADIELAPRVLPSLLEAAELRRAKLFSIMATLRTTSFWERLLVPAFIFFFKLLYPFAYANSPGSRVAAAAGGLILIETEVLRSIGGFESVRDALIDDCSLAAAVKGRGHGTWLGLSRSVRSRRAYRRLGDFWSMVRRTAFTQLRYSIGLLLLASAAMGVLFAAPVLALVLAPASLTGWLGLAAWLAMALAYLPIVAFYRLPLSWALSLPLTGLLFLAMTWDSAFVYWRGTRARWKDRAYEVPKH